jgi:hypothetical protein
MDRSGSKQKLLLLPEKIKQSSCMCWADLFLDDRSFAMSSQVGYTHAPVMDDDTLHLILYSPFPVERDTQSRGKNIFTNFIRKKQEEEEDEKEPPSVSQRPFCPDVSTFQTYEPIRSWLVRLIVYGPPTGGPLRLANLLLLLFTCLLHMHIQKRRRQETARWLRLGFSRVWLRDLFLSS